MVPDDHNRDIDHISGILDVPVAMTFATTSGALGFPIFAITLLLFLIVD
jgi:hypothetical protein